MTKKTTQAEHHLSLRRRVEQDVNLNFIDKLVIFVGPLIPVAAAIQAYDIWVTGNVEGVSLATWSLLTVTSFAMALYGIHHHEKPLILTYIPLFLVNILIVAGILTK